MEKNELIKKLKPYWVRAMAEKDKYFDAIDRIEKEMTEDLGIEELEFFFGDVDGLCGIGNTTRTLKLIHGFEIEEG